MLYHMCFSGQMLEDLKFNAAAILTCCTMCELFVHILLAHKSVQWPIKSFS